WTLKWQRSKRHREIASVQTQVGRHTRKGDSRGREVESFNERRQVIGASVIAERIFVASGRVTPPGAKRRPSGEYGTQVHDVEVIAGRWQKRPTLVYERNAARRKPRLPDEVERILAQAVREAGCRDRQHVLVSNVE